MKMIESATSCAVRLYARYNDLMADFAAKALLVSAVSASTILQLSWFIQHPNHEILETVAIIGTVLGIPTVCVLMNHLDDKRHAKWAQLQAGI